MNTRNQDFQFMLKEYEMLYGKFTMHYDAVERLIRIFLITVAAVLSSISIFYPEDDIKNFDLFSLNPIISSILFIVGLIGLFIFLNVIEHRMLIISYVRSLNLNRKWFADNSHESNPKLVEYLYWKTKISAPKYYSKHRHFHWEALFIATIVGGIFGLFITNIINHIYRLPTPVNICLTLAVVILSIILLINFYKRRGRKKEIHDRENQIKSAF